ncbi:hypothetical protein QN219_32845 [Sinorhizobium sp. 7-81]|uniref:hypothetical protein n=1 Tax=Sinorhizobium sp. 8-89 TaxID=3049089 RepID=UPI0024C3435C|nr:hypothetical protein [Sinorhizobium sp. 8-89]MDK1494704.1 hypothetical protein [Sinorhizobium sp. 8-89]
MKGDKDLELDVFAYDLNEPDVMKALISLGARARIILDNAALHHDTDKPKPEDQFEQKFAASAGAGSIKRGRFRRYAHHKVFIVKRNGAAQLDPEGLHKPLRHRRLRQFEPRAGLR